MYRRNIDQQGFGFLGALILIVVLGAIVLVGLRVMDVRNTHSSVSDSTRAASALPPTISSAHDLQTVSMALDTTNIDQVDVTQLDSDLNALL